MEITQLVEKNPTLLRLGLHLEYNDARHRIASHLQRNIDTSKFILFLHKIIKPKKFIPGLLKNKIYQKFYFLKLKKNIKLLENKS